MRPEAYFGYVVAMARRVYASFSPDLRRRVELADLVQDGCVGLLESVQRFDPSRGFRFLTFAHHRIVGEMKHTRRKATRLPAQLDDAPGGDEEEAEQPLSERVAARAPDPAEVLLKEEIVDCLRQALSKLNPQQRELIDRRFVRGETLQSIADDQGVGVSTVFNRQREILSILREALAREGYSVADLPEGDEGEWLAARPGAGERS